MHRSPMANLPCGFCEDLLIATALGEASRAEHRTAAAHLARCRPCHILLERYRRLREQLHALATEAGDLGLAAARQRLDARLEGGRPRLRLTIWRSPIGNLRIGSTDKGVALVEFAEPGRPEATPFHRRDAFVIDNDAPEAAALVAALEAYFGGTAQTLDWTVDDVLMRSEFQRTVLRATAGIPYGALVTYQSLAAAIGKPKAVRAVAQALRYNPVPIHIPCHRVIGSDGMLTGYAGSRVDLKRRILQVEGIPVVNTRKGPAVSTARMYVGWRRDRCFCQPQCATLKDQAAGDRTLIASRARAEAMGYEPCSVCRPDLQAGQGG
jgi:methylated-DNA-[protein]-cysteine S-methyltransferase